MTEYGTQEYAVGEVRKVKWNCLECGESGCTHIKNMSTGRPSIGKCPNCRGGDLMEEIC